MCLECEAEWGRHNFDKAAFWWWCSNDNCWRASYPAPIPAPEYDFRYYWLGIPKSEIDFENFPGLREEYAAMELAYLTRGERRRHDLF